MSTIPETKPVVPFSHLQLQWSFSLLAEEKIAEKRSILSEIVGNVSLESSNVVVPKPVTGASEI